MLSVVVVSYNTRALLRACLASVYRGLQASGLVGDVWVVDNASADGSADVVRTEFPSVHLIAQSENVGFAAANNLALQAIGFHPSPGTGTAVRSLPDAVLLLNPDTLVLDDALGILYQTLMDSPRVGAVGAALVYSDGGFQHSAFRFPDLPQVLFDFFPLNHRLTDSWLNGRYARALYAAGRPFDIDFPLGAALMVRREALQQVGLMDERFFIYCEEIDWCLRFHRAGWKVFCVPRARIVHYAGQSTQQFRDPMFIALWRSRFRLFEKHYSPLFRWVVRRLVAAGARWDIARARRRMTGEELGRFISAHQAIMEL
jgi:N-acetylglucosaminyl-diphospho-decaprenol L-rhamnosyltransferase